MNNIFVLPDHEGTRLDRFLRKKYQELNQARIEKFLRNKLILVNQQKVSSNYRLVANDNIQIDAKITQETTFVPQKIITKEHIKLITDSIIYRDDNLIAMNKPAGLAVQGGTKIKTSIDDIMPEVLKALGVYNEVGHKLVHRLDKETSGVMLIALNNKTAQSLAESFHDRKIQKKYLAILMGRPKNNQGEISTIQDGKKAISKYKVLAKNEQLSLLEFMPVTGRMHQLRLHALDLGFPIMGDSKYAVGFNKKTNLYLHALEIFFPYQSSILKIKAELPEYFQKAIDRL